MHHHFLYAQHQYTVCNNKNPEYVKEQDSRRDNLGADCGEEGLAGLRLRKWEKFNCDPQHSESLAG